MNKKTFIEFRWIGSKPKTRIYGVYSLETRGKLGEIHWYGPWRQYVFAPNGDTVWHKGCLEDVVAFLDKVNREHREKREKAYADIGTVFSKYADEIDRRKDAQDE
jgi:hypothetical protein